MLRQLAIARSSANNLLLVSVCVGGLPYPLNGFVYSIDICTQSEKSSQMLEAAILLVITRNSIVFPASGPIAVCTLLPVVCSLCNDAANFALRIRVFSSLLLSTYNSMSVYTICWVEGNPWKYLREWPWEEHLPPLQLVPLHLQPVV